MKFYFFGWFSIVIMAALMAGLIAHELVHFFGGGGDRTICFGYDESTNSIAHVTSDEKFKWWAGEYGAYTIQTIATIAVAALGGKLGAKL